MLREFIKKLLKVIVLLVLIITLFLLLCVQSAAGAAEEPMDKSVAEQVIRALVEAAEGNEWDPVVANFATVEGAGIGHIAGIDAEAVLTLDKPRWTAEEAQMLVTLAMAEAEGEDIIGKALVIMTVLNRVESKSFPNTIEGVIFQKGQFSPVAPGHRYYKVTPSEECWKALELVESGWDESCGALYFERNTTKSTWHSRNLIELFSHGNHTFYKEEK